MASLQDIRRRIDSTKKTSQITSAMQMVSSSKLIQIQKHTSGYLDYANHVEAIVAHLAAAHLLEHQNGSSIPFITQRPVKTTAILVITSDRGLVGGYNNQVLKRTDQIMREQKLTKENTVIFALGGKGSDYYAKRGFTIAFENRDITDVPKFLEVSDLVKEVTKQYAARKFDALELVFNHFINRLKNDVVNQQILPIRSENFQRDEKGNLTADKYKGQSSIYEFEPAPESLLKIVLPQFAQSLLYGAILDAKTAEHAASASAMRAATDNAKDLISTLELKYNRARQAAITTEITEITGGMAALQ
ncbi:F0F1 ATP synthase subunit gamma [Oenococcus oeni]|uniref:ATP synthase F1 subunit gamma n=1 Tax=Oenococcus oeni TaxID=1247 RepID=UPI0008F8ED0E|nr:ATP synthase F1 subunit gamma [Oenococcus oeni]OIM27061.1 F0F1 ATP synthase subunit gamma [Oenococcus oeni]